MNLSPEARHPDALDAIAGRAAQRMEALGLTPMALPEALSLESSWSGQPLSIRPQAWRGAQTPLARIVRVDGGEAVQVLNIVVFPAHDHALPVFGCELLQFRRGTHLFVLDAFPLVDGAPDACAAALSSLRARLYPALELSDEETPGWGEQVFSEGVMLVKPGARRALDAGLFADAVLELLDVWCEAARGARPGAHAGLLERRQTYLRRHGEEEPAGPFLTRIAGAPWVERFVFDFLYPRWLYLRDDAPQWPQT